MADGTSTARGPPASQPQSPFPPTTPEQRKDDDKKRKHESDDEDEYIPIEPPTAMEIEDSDDEDIQDVGSGTDDAPDGVSCDLDKLCGKSFSYWVANPKPFASNILKTSDQTLEDCAIDKRIAVGFELLSRYVDVSKRSVTLPKVVQTVKDIGELPLATATSADDMEKLSDAAHWAKFLLLLKTTQPGDLLMAAKIRGKTAEWGCLWVIAKIISRFRRPADLKRLEKRMDNRNRTAAENAHIASTQQATVGQSPKQALKAARTTIRLLKGRSVPMAKMQSEPKRKKLSPENVYDSDEDGDGSNAEEASSEEDEPSTPVPINGLTEDEVIESYVEEMDRQAEKATRDPAQVSRRKRAAQSLVEHMKSMRHRKTAYKAHYRDAVLLYSCARNHFDDIRLISQRNKRVNPLRKMAEKDFKRSQKAALLVSGAVEETPSTNGNILDVLVREEQAEVGQRGEAEAEAEAAKEAAATQQNRKDKEKARPQKIPRESVDQMIDIPDSKTEDPTEDMFATAKQNNKFAPTYLSLACIEAKITDLAKKIIPGMKFPLRWWQTIATKWVTDLPKNPITSNIRGGIIADMIGLGKTVQAGACVVKAVNMYKDAHDPAMERFRQMHPAPPRPANSPERPGDLAKPSLYVTSAALCHQTAKELAQMSSVLDVTLVGGDVQAAGGAYKCMDALPEETGEDACVWDVNRADNIKRLYVISYNLLAKYYGPQVFWYNVVLNLEKYLKEMDIKEVGFDLHYHMENNDNLPDNVPSDYVRSFENKFAYLFADEGQDCLRNPSSFWRTLRWFKPVALLIMSGYPAPRGMEDFGSYIRLLERPELKAEHDAMRNDMSTADDMPEYIPGVTNPYELKDDDPNYKFCFLYENWSTFITNQSSPSYDDRVRQAKLAQRTLEKIVLRRDFETALPVGSDNTIGRSIPPKHHFTIERMFTPSTQRIYSIQFARWKKRLFTTHQNSSGSNVPAMNARANKASQIIDFCPILGYLHIERPYEKRPRNHKYGDDDDSLDEKYNRDRESWFYDGSTLFQQYNAIEKMKRGGSGKRLRWILKTARSLNCDLLDAKVDFDNMENVDLAELFLKFSPKMQAIISLVMDWCLLRDEKVIFWFMTPAIQEMAQTVLELLGHDVFSVYSTNNTKQRQQVQDQWNSPKTNKRILLASALVFGTGYNLQKDCRVGVMVDTPDTDNREKQVQGRTYRGGQTLESYFFRLTVRGTYAISRLAENLLGSLSASSAFLNYESLPDQDLSRANIPDDLLARVTDNFLEGFIRIPDVPDAVAPADFRYVFIFSQEGQDLVHKMREEEEHSDDWWPETLPYTLALAGISARMDTRRLCRVAGFPNDVVNDLVAMTEEELTERADERKRANEGVDPDDRYYGLKTPKKAKAGQEMSRTYDTTTVADQIHFPTNAPPGSSWLDAPGSKKPKELFRDLMDEDEEKAKNLADVLKANEKDTAADLSDYTDFEESQTVFDQVLGRVRKHKSYKPSFDKLQELDSQEKRKVTLAIKVHDKDYDPPKPPKAPKSKSKANAAKGRGRKATGAGRRGATNGSPASKS